MRAVVCGTLGAPEVLTLEEVATPEPGEGEVLIAVAAAGINFADTLMIRHEYQVKPPLPFTPGLEVAGHVEALGAGVSGLSVGQRVLALPAWGGFAEKVVAPATSVFAVPESMPFDIAAGFTITYGTALGALEWHARLVPGETLVVHGAAGGVGLAAVEVGKAMGAKVIATAGGAEKLEIAKRHGADACIDYRSEDLRTRMKELTDGRGADVVFDPVGGDVFDASLRAIAWGGRILVIGFAGGRVQQIPANHLLVKNVAAMGVHWGSYLQKAPEMLRQQFEVLCGWHAEGKLNPRISDRLPLEAVAEALMLLVERKASGKVVLDLS